MIGSDLLFSRKAVYHCSFEIVFCHADAIVRESRCCCNSGFVGNVTCDTFTIKWALRGPYFGNCTFSSLTNGRGSWIVGTSRGSWVVGVGVGVGEELIMILNKGTYEEVQLIIWCTLSR